ncbi:hypothetical protein AKJ45_01970 [candidate division MSBL1 archaeon SCGC-AAA261F19]|uniref:Uncharacterized protein n=1 Tax=candidate division MSBL1 archaeon SCGC-AAA261F19 TaxID=1698275 RepID=A0A133VA31_9EURY|nr:hypothetical protein AKJ45_01970 [candidate division MSBL1 archaeon SCGC-AAA261F19]
MTSNYITYCSAKKRESGKWTPDKLYISQRIDRFVERCKDKSLDWAIFSALYGFFFPQQKKSAYDVTMKTDYDYWLGVAVIRNKEKLSRVESEKHLSQLIRKIKQQAKDRDIDRIFFYGPSPMMMRCYLEVLHYAFDDCSVVHGWKELQQHIEEDSNVIKVIHKISDIR